MMVFSDVSFTLSLALLTAVICQAQGTQTSCNPRDFGHGSFVCVCNSSSCDTLGAVPHVPSGQFLVYTSNKAGLRFYKEVHKFTVKPGIARKTSSCAVDRSAVLQSIVGFGGAITDAAAINILSLSPPLQEKLLRSYYSPDGIEYTFGRIPMAGCDFSTRTYTYDEEDGDFNMTHFNLTDEDYRFKIPVLQRILEMSKREVQLLASPWSAPTWMKTNDGYAGKSALKGDPGGEYYQAWAEYFLRFFEEYSKFNLSFWAVTAQNEPTDGEIANFTFNSMGFTADTQREFVSKNLGPTLERGGYSSVKILILDDQRLMLPKWAQTVLSDPVANKYVAGIAVHWYLDFVVPPDVLTLTHNKFPDKFILATEACEGSLPWERDKVALGSWDRAESYAHNIIQDLQHWAIGWIDWNLALDMEGGPNWARNFVDSPIIVNAKENEFYKQPMFYSMGHFSKFIQPQAKQIKLSPACQDVESVAFENGDGSIAVVVLNRKDYPVPISIQDPKQGYINMQVSAHSVQTLLWWP